MLTVKLKINIDRAMYRTAVSSWLARGLVAALLVTLGACVRVRPHERQRLSSSTMAPPFATAVAEHDGKATQTRTGGALPGTVAGGGCGCTQ